MENINMSDLPTSVNVNAENSSLPPLPNKRRKRKNKNKRQNKQLNAKKKFSKLKPNGAPKAVLAMSAWAEQFTFAATWQLKHQLAYWKAKAKALQYENGVLHDIIRQNHSVNSETEKPSTSKMCVESDEEKQEKPSTSKMCYDPDEEKEEQKDLHINNDDSTMEEGKLGEWTPTDGIKSGIMITQTQSDDSLDEKLNIEVSEEYIEFLMINAKHKEQIRLERERLKNLEDEAAMKERESKLRARRHYGLSMQELYGEKWQKISALEMSIKSNFLSYMDSSKAAYWPVIPFNFEMFDS